MRCSRSVPKTGNPRFGKCHTPQVHPEDPMGKHHDPASSIVVGIDGSPSASAAAPWAVDEAGMRGAPLWVLTARQPHFTDIHDSHAAAIRAVALVHLQVGPRASRHLARVTTGQPRGVLSGVRLPDSTTCRHRRRNRQGYGWCRFDESRPTSTRQQPWRQRSRGWHRNCCPTAD
jgi:Universal stress protein family